MGKFGVKGRKLEGQMVVGFAKNNGKCWGEYLLPEEKRRQGHM